MSNKPTVYVAGWYNRREELLQLSRSLEQRGWNVTSRWLTRRQDIAADGKDTDNFHVYAQEDIDDIDRSDVFILVSNEEGQLGGGGRHFELGYIYSTYRSNDCANIYTVGPFEHVFYALPGIGNFDTWEDLLEHIDAVFQWQ